MDVTHNLVIFISHDRSDETLALLLKEFLEGLFLNASVFVSGADLRGGKVWVEELREALKAAAAILTVVTPRSANNRWVLFEAGAGFCDRRTNPILADSISFESLDAPLQLLQGRLYSEDGLKQLVSDIAQRAGLRVPNNYPGLESVLDRAEQFVADRKQTDKTSTQASHVSAVQKSSLFEPPDVKLLALYNTLELRFKKLLVKAIEKARDIFDLPAPQELERMPLRELREVAAAVAIPYPDLLTLRLILQRSTMPSADASSWKKLNAQRNLGQIETELAEYEQELA